MGNVCTSYLNIYGNTEAFTDELDNVESGVFQHFLPIKEGERGCDVWGTDSDVLVGEMDGYGWDNYCGATLQTSRAPPIFVAKEISRRYPDTTVILTFQEFGENYMGYRVFVAGDLTAVRDDEIPPCLDGDEDTYFSEFTAEDFYKADLATHIAAEKARKNDSLGGA